MKRIITLVALLMTVATFAQEQKIDYKKTDDGLVMATYFFADNDEIVERVGYFNKKGELHGTWISYDKEGNKTAIANYVNGKKDGLWTYFKSDKINIVTYKQNKIVDVEEKLIVTN